jgi:hypothetical protein
MTTAKKIYELFTTRRGASALFKVLAVTFPVSDYPSEFFHARIDRVALSSARNASSKVSLVNEQALPFARATVVERSGH